MTLNGAINQLHELRSAEDMPIYYKLAIAEVINVLLMDACEVKRGEWIEHTDTRFGIKLNNCIECNCCRVWFSANEMNRRSFCPNCGADMRTKETDRDYERSVEQLEHDMLYEPTYNPDDGSM